MAKQDHDSLLVAQLSKSIEGREAHLTFESVLSDFPPALRGVRPEGGPHSAWELLEHMRIAQHDILEFSRDANHQSPSWPEGYWPSTPTPPHEGDWDKAVLAFQTDRKEFEKLLNERASGLFEPIAHGDGQTLLREAMLIASHNSYHLGQFAYVKRLLTKSS